MSGASDVVDGTPVIAALALLDADELLAFELRNRAFFETWVTPRPPDYYSAAGVAAAIERGLQDARADLAYQFLVRAGGRLVGRVNLTQVRRAHYASAALGFRVDEACRRTGVARRGVALVAQQARDALGLVRLEATARPENVGSQRVLEANGFVPFGRSTRSFCLHDRWFDLLHYETRLTD